MPLILLSFLGGRMKLVILTFIVALVGDFGAELRAQSSGGSASNSNYKKKFRQGMWFMSDKEIRDAETSKDAPQRVYEPAKKITLMEARRRLREAKMQLEQNKMILEAVKIKMSPDKYQETLEKIKLVEKDILANEKFLIELLEQRQVESERTVEIEHERYLQHSKYYRHIGSGDLDLSLK